MAKITIPDELHQELTNYIDELWKAAERTAPENRYVLQGLSVTPEEFAERAIRESLSGAWSAIDGEKRYRQMVRVGAQLGHPDYVELWEEIKEDV